MHLKLLEMQNFRLIRRAHLDLEPGVNLLEGANAQGKTTVLEAVSYVSRGRSFRTPRDRECLAREDGEESAFASIEAEFELRDVSHRVRVAVEPRKKSVWLDDKPLPALSGLWGKLQTVVFVPSDLQIVQGPPALRRGVIDTLLGQTDPSYLRVLGDFHRALQNRNQMIRDRINARDSQYDAFESAMADLASRLMIRRGQRVAQLSRACSPPMEKLTASAETLTLSYEPGVPAASGVEAESLQEGEEQAVREKLNSWWAASRTGDLDRGVTRDGPHRDDIRFEISGTDARTYASQGQVRSCVLALRLAERQLCEEETGTSPLLLLDDILAELDRERSCRFLELLRSTRVQTLITVTDAMRVETLLTVGKRFHIEKGIIEPA